MSAQSGVYGIRHVASGKVYVGSAVSIPRRKQGHLSRLAKGTHHSARLQRAWAKYGAAAFEWIVFELVPDVTQLIQREQAWIDKLKAADKPCGFNMTPTAGSTLGSKYTPEGLANLAAWRAANPVPQSTRDALRAKYQGIPRPADVKAKVSRSLTGKKRRPESIAKLKATVAGRKRPVEWVENQAATLRGRPRPLDVRAKISATKRAKATSRYACAHCGNEIKQILTTHTAGLA